MNSSGTADVTALEDEIATLSAHLDAASHRLLQCIREFDDAKGWHLQGALSCAHWLAWRLGWDPGTAREKVRVARALGTLPAMDEALRTAQLSYCKVRALTRVATPENEERLLKMALVATGSQLERLCRGYGRAVEGQVREEPSPRTVCLLPMLGGMVKLEIVLERDEADLLLRAIRRGRELKAEAAPANTVDVSAETPWPGQADGAVFMAESFLASNPVAGTGGERYQVMVHLEQDVLAADGEWTGTLEDGSHVSAETLRRVACDCGIVVAGKDGEALNIGRRARSIPPALRRAAMLRDRFRGVPRKGCAFPGCTHLGFLHGHHVKHWLHGGETSLLNIVTLCSFHHHLVHEGGWRVEPVEGGSFAFHAPTGRRMTSLPRHNPVESGERWLQLWAEERELELGPRSNRPRWDGTRPDYEWAVWTLTQDAAAVLPPADSVPSRRGGAPCHEAA